MSGPAWDPEMAAVLDFTAAARVFAAGDVSVALKGLLPLELDQAALERRVRQLLWVGAALAADLGPCRDGGVCADAGVRLAGQLQAAGAAGDGARIDALISPDQDVDVLTGALTELVARVATGSRGG